MLYLRAIVAILFLGRINGSDDTVFVPSLDLTIGDGGQANLYFRNLVVTGLKNRELCDISSYLIGKSDTLQTQANIKISGELTLIFTKNSKLFEGSFTYRATALINAEPNRDLLDYKFGLQNLNCEVLGKVDVDLSPGLQKAVEEDEELFNQNIEYVFCTIVKEAYNEVYNGSSQ